MTSAVLADGSNQAGPLGLLVIALLGLAVYFLGRSLSKHLRRVPPSFDPPDPASPAGERPPDQPAG
jgi:hypothetical protein